jgi:hypothetical protein
MNKYCRICWNTSYWRGPTGEAAELEGAGSYVRENGFGHEEWLFNFFWLQPGPEGISGSFRYGFLQPIGRYRKKYRGQSFDVFLYTVMPDGRRMAVGIIKKLHVPQDAELAAAHHYMRKEGWLAEMKADLSEIGASSRGLAGDPANVINVRFRQSDVHFFEPRYVLPKNHVTNRIDRYQPLNWIGSTPSAKDPASHPPAQKDGKRRSEKDRVRAAVESTVYSPQHVKLQNALFDHLCARFGREVVNYEMGYIDLQLRHGGVQTLFEIKIAPTPKSCIRQAIGQLLEYDLYPNRKRSSQLVVVGDGATTRDDESYLRHLQEKFGIPIMYRRWNWERLVLEGNF